MGGWPEPRSNPTDQRRALHQGPVGFERGEHASERGFSLLELVVVVGVAAIVMAVLTLGIRQASDSFTLRRAATLVVNEVRRAQATAMAEDVDYTVEFYTAGGEGGLRVWKAGAASAARTVLPPEWPSSVHMVADTVNPFSACAASIDPNHQCVTFAPLGYPDDDGKVRLQVAGSGSELTVTVEPASGRVKVER